MHEACPCFVDRPESALLEGINVMSWFSASTEILAKYFFWDSPCLVQVVSTSFLDYLLLCNP